MGLMDLLQGDDDRNQLRDFSDRFQKGRPDEGYDEKEAHERYEQVNRHLDDDEYESSARDAFSHLSPEERRHLGRELRDRSKERGHRFDDGDDDGDDSKYEDAGHLARSTRRMREKDPGLLGSLLGGGGGGGGGGGLGSLLGGGGGGGGIAKVVLGGIAAMAAKRASGGR